jgi:hypothetical protein
MPAQLLAEPVEYGDVRLAPTTELAALAELAAATDDDERVATLKRVAATIRDEDAARAHMARLRARAEQADAPSLPRRR